MIHLVPSLTLDGRFSAQDLPDALHLPLLNSMVVPRIASSSMTPTIQEGDRLELSSPTSLTVRAIVVFRNDALLVCHRITTIDPEGTLSTRGDATQGACEIVQPASVIGVVTGVIREGTHMSLEKKATPVIRRSTADQNHESRSDCRRPLGHPEYSCPCKILTFPAPAGLAAPMGSHGRCPYSCTTSVSPLPLQGRLVHTSSISTECRTPRTLQRTEADVLHRPTGTLAVGALRPSYRGARPPPISPIRRSGVVLPAHLR